MRNALDPKCPVVAEFMEALFGDHRTRFEKRKIKCDGKIFFASFVFYSRLFSSISLRFAPRERVHTQSCGDVSLDVRFARKRTWLGDL
jgi:hypothetical protein